jgi:beta-glucanase (GH16 family)
MAAPPTKAGYTGPATAPTTRPTQVDEFAGERRPTAVGLDGRWRLTLADEFEGVEVDSKKWQTAWREFDAKGKIFFQPYRFLGCNLKENLTVRDGALNIRVAREPVSWDPKVKYTTGVINSAQRFSQRYGFFEVRLRSPASDARGTDASFFLFAEANRWPPEIDVCEIPGSGEARRALLNHHFVDANGKRGDAQKYVVLPEGKTFHDAYRTFAVLWEPGLIVWYVDGQERHRRTEYVPDEPMVLFATVEIQGSWCGDPERGAWPQRYQVDYIRVYERAPG